MKHKYAIGNLLCGEIQKLKFGVNTLRLAAGRETPKVIGAPTPNAPHMEILGFMSLTPDKTFTKVPDGQDSNTGQINSLGPTGAIMEHATGALWPNTMFAAARRATHAG